MLADDEVELVVVSLPSYLHPSASVEALQAGKHVVCEKPMAVRLSDADRMIAAAKEAERTLTVFQNYRYDPDYLKVREVIESGKLGRIVMIRMAWQGFGRRWDWQTLQSYDGGSLNNTGPHPIDIALQLFGPGKPELFCHLERTLTLGDAEDHVKLILTGPDAPMLDVEFTSACAYPQEAWLVMGTQGTLAGTRRALRWKYLDPAQLPPRQVDERPTPDRSYNREPIEWTEETWDRSEYSGPRHTGFYLDLHETIRHGGPLAVTPESVRRQVAILEECHRRFPTP
jgi:predicted dehydrogenase